MPNNLRDLLDTFCPEAAEIVGRGVQLPYAFIGSGIDRWHTMVADVREAMQADSRYSEGGSSFFLGTQIMFSEWQAASLLEQCARRGADGAIAWYNAIRKASTADMDVICEVNGLIVREVHTFSNGVTLLPLSILAERPQSRHLIEQASVGRGSFHHAIAAALMTFHDVPAETDHNPGYDRYLAAIRTITQTINAFTLIDRHTPTIGISWTEFHDEDLSAGRVGYSWKGAVYDGRMTDHPTEIDPLAYNWIEKFLALQGHTFQKCEVALARLNLARRRKTPGDQAIDGCIALEAMLSDRNQQGDLTYKLKLRSARLLGKTFTDRSAISTSVGKFYSLRSKVVHGQSSGISETDQRDAKRGLELCLAVLRTIVGTASIPDLTGLELGPMDDLE